MGEKILLIAEFGLKMTMFEFGFRYLFNGKIKKIWAAVIVYAMFIGIVLWSSIDIVNLGGILWVFILLLQFVLIVPPDFKKYGWLIERIIIICYIEELLTMLFGDFFEIIGNHVTDSENSLITDIVVLLLFLTAYLIRSTGRHSYMDKKKLRRMRNGMLVAVVFVAIEIEWCVVGLNYMANMLHNERYLINGKIVSLLSMFGIGVLILFVYYIRNSNMKMEKLIEMEELMQQQQVYYYEALLKKEEATRQYRHDMIGHLACLREFTDAEDVSKIGEYLDGLQEKIERIKKTNVSTGCEVLDTVLTYYISQLEEDVAVKIIGRCDKDLDISDVDLCMIFSNLIKNAVDYLNHCQLQGRYLLVKIEEGTEHALIEVKNLIDKSHLSFEKNGKLQTTKQDKKNHGIGLKNVENGIKENNGKFNFYVVDNEFCCEVVLNIKKDTVR